jgi:hypothetical protein
LLLAVANRPHLPLPAKLLLLRQPQRLANVNPAWLVTVLTLLLPQQKVLPRLPKVQHQLLRLLKALLRLLQPLKVPHRLLRLPKALLQPLTLQRQNDSSPLCGRISQC